jgi:hypothetical protein
MQYVLIFDVAESGFRNWWFPAVGLIFVAVGIFLVKNRKILPYMFPGQMGPKDGVKLGSFVLACSVLWIAFTFRSAWLDYSSLKNALKDGNIEVVEGWVENFVSIPHKTERFSVCGASFSYSNYVVTAGFNNTNSYGGPIHERMWVRIAHVGNSIARLETARQDAAEGVQCHRFYRCLRLCHWRRLCYCRYPRHCRSGAGARLRHRVHRRGAFRACA